LVSSSTSNGSGGSPPSVATRSSGTTASGGSTSASSSSGATVGVTATATALTSTSTTAASTASTGGVTDSDALDRLREYPAIERGARPAPDWQEFARVALSAADADTARTLPRDGYARLIASARTGEQHADA